MLKHDLAYATEQGSKELEIVASSLVREDGSSGEEARVRRDPHPPGRPQRPSGRIEDPVISFALHDENNKFVFGTNTDWKGLRFHPFEGKKRLRFHLRSLPFVGGSTG
jgi:hypothetical protein